jgi:phenylacetate-CoA ligase
MYLENWIHERIRRTAEKEPEFARLLQISRSAPISRATVENYQLFKLRQTLQYAYKNSSFYRNLFIQNKIIPEEVSSLNDLSAFPLTESHRLAESPYRFLCISQSEIARSCTFVTSGTTGPQKKIFWTQDDLDGITDFMAAGIGVVACPEDVVLIILPDGRPNSQADLLSQGVIKLGATPVVAGFDSNAEELMLIIERFHPAVIFGYSGRIFRISKDLQTSHDLSSAGVRILFLAAEYLPDARRNQLQAIWKCQIHTHYGLAEMGLGVAVECSSQNGYHFNEADLLLEIVDPQTGKAVEPGMEGELVFTTLTREATPLIRYRTHDISRYITESCICGASSLLKFGPVKKRLESIVRTASGDELYPALFDDLLYEIPDLIDYQAILERNGNEEQLFFKVEMARQGLDPVPGIIRRLSLEPAIARGMALGKMFAPRVELVVQGTLKSDSRAKKLIVDCR